MKSVRKWIRNVFGFSGNEINGFLILIPLMVVLVFSEPVYRAWLTHQERSYAGDLKKLDSLAAILEKVEAAPPKYAPRVTLFEFDPNHASLEELKQLGFSPALANRIAAYRTKGGEFRVKKDLAKIYGLDSALYKQLYNYIALPVRPLGRPAGVSVRPEPQLREKRETKFDINTADTTALKSVYGIGSVLARRIVSFRSGLGGFVAIRQLQEVYGLDTAVVKRLSDKCFIRQEFVPARIDINTANERELSRHPYIDYDMARAIANYRFQHGDFIEPSDIKKLSALKSVDVERILPYLKVRD